MKTLAVKMSKPGLLRLEGILGTLIMAAAMAVLPIGIIAIDAALLLNPYVLGVVLAGMLMFGLVGYFIFIRPNVLYCKLPEVQAESDGEFLYIHSKKEAKIPLSALKNATAYFQLPYILQKEFISEFLIHFFSEKYGDIVLEVPGYGNYKMYFIANAEDTAGRLADFISETTNNVKR